MSEEVWSVKCTCGAIKTISEKLRNAIVEHQKSKAPYPPSEWREKVEDEDGFTLSLSCDSCDKSIEYSWSMIMMPNVHTGKRDRPDTEPGHVGVDRDEDGSESFIGLYVTPNSWVKGTIIEAASTSRQSDVSGEKGEAWQKLKRQLEQNGLSSEAAGEVATISLRWTCGHSTYFLQFALSGIDNNTDSTELEYMKRRMGENKDIQETLGKDGYPDEEERFEDTRIYYENAKKFGNAEVIRILRGYLPQIAETHQWNDNGALSRMYVQMFDIALADGEVWTGEVDILQTLIDEWGLGGIPLLKGMRDASGYVAGS